MNFLHFLKNLSVLLYIVLLILSIIIFLALKYYRSGNKLDIAFFHPNALEAGGGERVLWFAIQALQKKYTDHRIFVYIKQSDAVEHIFKDVEKKFGIYIDPQYVKFIPLKLYFLYDAKYYPVLTMLCQLLASIILSVEAWAKFKPGILIDTSGFAFSYPIFKYFASHYVISYVHYPILTDEMAKCVKEKRVQYNNSFIISRFPILTKLKVYYYKILSIFYAYAGSRSDLVLVNSTWTLNHIKELWNNSNTHILFPPCDIYSFSSCKNIAEAYYLKKQINILSLGQFRPEKNHEKQIKSFKGLLNKLKKSPGFKDFNVQLYLVGGCRNVSDENRIKILKNLTQQLELDNLVKFCISPDFQELKDIMSKSLIGIHTMWNEHFGIAIVESMAAGMIMIAHNSGGPKLDILEEYKGKRIGFLADNEDEYSEIMLNIIEMSKEERNELRKSSLEAVKTRFSNQIFENRFIKLIDPYLK